MRFKFDIAGSQINGARDYQEDAFLITHVGDHQKPESGSIVIVADGMGGHAAGNVASNMAVQSCNKHITSMLNRAPLHQVLRESVLQANNAIAVTVKETEALKGMGCTIVGAVFDRTGMHWVSVGDSHLYLIRQGNLEAKNSDHSYGGFLDRLAAAGQPAQPEPGLTRNMLMSALTGDEITEIDCPAAPFDLQLGDRLIVCSDGLDTLTREQIVRISLESRKAKLCVDRLLAAVEEEREPRQDNTTVIVVDVIPNRSGEETATVVADQAGSEPGRRAGSWVGGMLGALLFAGLAFGGYYYFSHRVTKPKPEPSPAPTPDITATPTATPVTTPAPTATPTAQATPTSTAPVAIQSVQDKLASGGLGPELVELPGGTYQMGSTRAGADYDETPAHVVTLKPFAIMRYEVTVADYARYAKAKGSAPLPVTGVSWDEANRYAQWLSQQTGKRYRVPSEAEWEYAAGASQATPYWWGFQPGEHNAHCYGCNPGGPPSGPVKAGSFKANPFGLFDTAGNVGEWVADCYNASYAGAPTDGSVWSSGDCKSRVVRGGGFGSPSKSIRTTKRNHYQANHGYDDVGFRLVRDP